MSAKPLGPPGEMTIDAGKALSSAAMGRGSERDQTNVSQGAGEAHEQVGLIERHKGMFREVLDRVFSDCQPQSEEVPGGDP